MTIPMRARRVLLLGAPLALLAACASNDKPPPAPVQKAIERPGKTTVEISERNDGASVMLASSQELVVSLFNPSSAVVHDMEWSIVDLPPGKLEVLGTRFERAPRDNNPADAAGSTIWRIKPLATGPLTLKFALRRPRSLDPAIQTVSFALTIQ